MPKDERLNAGDLNRYVQYQTKIEAADALGQPVETWSTIHSLWASIRSPNGRESLEAQQRTATINRVVEHHHVPEVNALARYVVDDGAILNVVWSVDPDARKVATRSFCVQDVVPGP